VRANTLPRELLIELPPIQRKQLPPRSDGQAAEIAVIRAGILSGQLPADALERYMTAPPDRPVEQIQSKPGE
jgi:hypothetical protein